MNKREGTFWHEDEALTVLQITEGSEFDGMYEVIDSEGFRISCAFTSKLAVQMAIDEIEYIQYHLNSFLIQMFGECA